MWVFIRDIITYATFGDDRLKVLGVAGGRISHLPIDLGRRPYNTLALPCECVILPLGQRRPGFPIPNHVAVSIVRVSVSRQFQKKHRRLIMRTRWLLSGSQLPGPL